MIIIGPGLGFIVTVVVVLLHPVLVCVNVNVTLPAETPVTIPAFVTVAIAGLLLIHVPPVVGDNVVVPFTQIEELPIMFTIGNAFTLTTNAAEVNEQPLLLVTVTV